MIVLTMYLLYYAFVQAKLLLIKLYIFCIFYSLDNFLYIAFEGICSLTEGTDLQFDTDPTFHSFHCRTSGFDHSKNVFVLFEIFTFWIRFSEQVLWLRGAKFLQPL